MALNLGQNPWILIVLIFLEIFLIIIPALVASKLGENSFKEELKEMGFRKNMELSFDIVMKIFAGFSIGILFFLISGYILFFFNNIIVETIFGNYFVEKGREGVLRTEPIKPNIIQIIIVIILQFIIVGPCEEGFFRGFVFKKCSQKIKIVYSYIISSILFSIYHTPFFLVPIETIITYFGYYFTFGLFLALIFKYFKNSIIPGSIAHAIFNVMILLF